MGDCFAEVSVTLVLRAQRTLLHTNSEVLDVNLKLGNSRSAHVMFRVGSVKKPMSMGMLTEAGFQFNLREDGSWMEKQAATCWARSLENRYGWKADEKATFLPRNGQASSVGVQETSVKLDMEPSSGP